MKNRLRELRLEKEMTQGYIQRKVGIYQSYISKYEHECRDIPLYVLMALADFFNTSMDYIMYRTDVREPYPKREPDEELG